MDTWLQGKLYKCIISNLGDFLELKPARCLSAKVIIHLISLSDSNSHPGHENQSHVTVPSDLVLAFGQKEKLNSTKSPHYGNRSFYRSASSFDWQEERCDSSHNNSKASRRSQLLEPRNGHHHTEHQFLDSNMLPTECPAWLSGFFRHRGELSEGDDPSRLPDGPVFMRVEIRNLYERRAVNRVRTKYKGEENDVGTGEKERSFDLYREKT